MIESAFAKITQSDVEAIERLSEAAIRSGDTQTALAGFALALRFSTILRLEELFEVER